MQKKLREILHRYKVNAYKLTHDPDESSKVTRECLAISKDVLDNAYEYHFHKLPDANRIEIINMINNYTIEAILPPIVEKLVKRIVLLEKQYVELLSSIEEILEAIE